MERKSKLEYDCEHPSVLYSENESAWICLKCNEKLIKCGKVEFRLFCELSGKDPKSMMA